MIAGFRRRFREFTFGLVIGLAVCAAAVAAEQTEASSLASVVPADIGLCIEAEGLHARLETFLEGPLYARWREYPPFAVWHAQQQLQLAKFNSVLKAKLGISLEALRSELFGRQWLLAVYPPKSDEQFAGRDVPDGFLLVRATEPELLEKAIEKLIAAERDDGRYLRASTSEVAGRTFTIHEFEDEAKHEVYLTFDGDLGCLATDREKLIQVLALHAAAGSRPSGLAALPQYIAARKQLAPAAVLRAFVHARIWEPYYQALAEHDEEPEKEEARKFRQLWSHLDSIAAGLELGTTTRLEAYLTWNDKSLTPELRELLDRLGKRRSSAAAVPSDCLAALALQVDVKSIIDAVMPVVRREADDKGRRVPTEALLIARLAGGLGPGLTAFVTPNTAHRPQQERPKSDDRKEKPATTDAAPGVPVVEIDWPVDWVVGIDTQPLKAGEPSLADVLDPLIRVGLTLAADAYNSERKPTGGGSTAQVSTEKIGELQVTGLTGLGPLSKAGVFTARHLDRLWFGGAPQSLARASSLKAEESLEKNSLYRQMHNGRWDDADQFLFVNLQEVRRTVGAVAAQPPVWLADLKKDSAQAGLRELQTLLALADAALLEGSLDSTGARVALAVGVAEAK